MEELLSRLLSREEENLEEGGGVKLDGELVSFYFLLYSVLDHLLI